MIKVYFEGVCKNVTPEAFERKWKHFGYVVMEEQSSVTEPEEMTKKEIMLHLDEKGITYNPRDTKGELLELLGEEGGE